MRCPKVKSQGEHKAQQAKLQVPVFLLGSLIFRAYTVAVRDILTSIYALSLGGEERNCCASRMALCLRKMRKELQEGQKKPGAHERWLRHKIALFEDKVLRILDGWKLVAQGVGGDGKTQEALLEKLIDQLQKRFQN